MDLSNRLKKKMEERSLSINALEKKAGVRPCSVQNILYGRSKSPGINTLKSIAQALGCNLIDLIGEEEQAGNINGSNNLNEECDIDLLFSVVQTLKTIIATEKVTLSYRNILECIQYSYDYSQFKKQNNADDVYTHWLVNKIKNKIK